MARYRVNKLVGTTQWIVVDTSVAGHWTTMCTTDTEQQATTVCLALIVQQVIVQDYPEIFGNIVDGLYASAGDK